jgi:hypothetical protein
LALAALRAWLRRLVPSICLAIATRQRGRNDMARKIGSQRRFGRDRGKGTGVLDVTVLDATVLCVAVWVGSVVDGGASNTKAANRKRMAREAMNKLIEGGA